MKNAQNAIGSSDAPRILSPFVLAELDYLLVQWSGPSHELRFLTEVTRGVFHLPFDTEDVDEAIAVIQTYHDLNIGLADASIVVLANGYGCRDVLTLDERHFRPLRTRRGAFRILPADA
ncbi:MAG TPA: PIN domain-containing protein [Thermoanaerobaculia bacterium]|nr:PIN domain-containing protein [Thermoanaerobaculia bacterium]